MHVNGNTNAVTLHQSRLNDQCHIDGGKLEWVMKTEMAELNAA